MSIIGSNILAGAAGSGVSAYEIEQSLRFNSAWLNKTFSSAGSRTTWTFSCWIKGGLKNGNIHEGRIFGVGSDASGDGQGSIYYSANQLIFYHRIGSGTEYSFGSDARFRDPSAWHHLVVVWDTDNATAADRWRFYDNGVRLTSATASTLPSGYNSNQNAAVAHGIGVLPTSPSAYFNGYLAEVNFIDGSALDPEDFGELDDNGVWRPIKYAGSYTGNSFYLKFASGDGTDSSGLSNNWTANNFTTSGTGTDVMSDTPTTNWCTLNPLKSTGATLSNGNLDFSNGAVDQYLSVGTIGVTSGKWYWETTKTGGSQGSTGIVQGTVNTNRYVGQSSDGWGYLYTGSKVNNATTGTYGNSYTTNDVIGVAFDADAGSLYFYKNGVAQNSGTAAYTGLTNGPYFPAVGSYDSNFTTNFGQRAFAYTPPTGFKALNTSNLPAPDIADGSQYFDTLTWTGDSSGATRTFSGLAFQPDLVWAKGRNQAISHQLTDAVRGAGATSLRSDDTRVEGADGTASGYLSAFTSDGFTSTSSSTNVYYNTNTYTYVAWNWLAGNGTSSNTAGSITSTVSANPTAGFSIVSYTGTGSAATVGHGLGVAPKMVIVKDRDNSNFWVVGHQDLGGTGFAGDYYIRLNEAFAGEVGGGVAWNSTNPTSTVFSIGTSTVLNGIGNDHIAYCFAEVEGYSKFGSYTGNGNADGPFVYCGFKPAWIMIKNSTTGGASRNWAHIDSTRSYANVGNHTLAANLSDGEGSFGTGVNVFGTYNKIDILSNGFKIRENNVFSNTSSDVYIFAAFAENPFGGSGISPATAR